MIDNKSYSQREFTGNGYLTSAANASRVGLQDYYASELGIAGVPPTTIVKVLRSEEEVFKEDSLKSFYGVPITVDHPPEQVNSHNNSKYECGTVMTEGRKNGDYVEIDLIIKDADAIEKLQSGKEELSVGYATIYEDILVEDGKLKTHESKFGEYHARQTDITVNHVSLVQAGRAGQSVRVFDEKTNGENMETITLDSGTTVDITAENGKHIVAEINGKNKQIKSLNDSVIQKDSKIKELKDLSVNKDAELSKTQAALDAEKEKVKEIEGKVSDAAINSKVKEITNVIKDCRKIAGDTFDSESCNPVELKKAALVAFNSSIALDGKSDEYVNARFEIAVEDHNGKEKESEKYNNQMSNLTADSVETQEVVTSYAQDYVNNQKNKGD